MVETAFTTSSFMGRAAQADSSEEIGRKQKAESRKQKAESRKQKAESRKQDLFIGSS